MKKTFLIGLIITAFCGLLIGCSNAESEKGDYIIKKGISGTSSNGGSDIHQILVVTDITKKEALTKSPSDFINEEADLMWYQLEDTDLYEELNVGEKVTVKIETHLMDGKSVYNVKFSYPPQAKASGIIRHDN